MKRKINVILIGLFVLNSILFAEIKQIEAVKKESTITYQLTHLLHEVESTSKEAYCTIDVDPTTKEIKKVTVQVDVTTFDSGNSNRDSHAMEAVDALTYPDTRFASTSISQKGDSLKVYGKLTFHGITKDIVISAATKWTNNKLIVNGNFNISLTAFKVERPSLLLIPVKDTLKFSLTQVFNIQ
ncbi:MAG: YceI family protein [Ignavibacteriales bacterium]|nr:YceI family protein [Ignavibacteriales bacterium]